MASAKPVRRKSVSDITTKLRWIICAPPCLVMIVMITFGALRNREIVSERARAEAEDQMENLALRVREFYDRAIVLSRSIASHQKALGDSPRENTRQTLEALLKDTPPYDAQGVYIAFQGLPYTHPDAVQWVWRERPPGIDKDKVYTPEKLTYDFHEPNDQTEWYQGAKKKADGGFFITKPYQDKDSKVWMVSVTRPIYVGPQDNSRFVGVAGVDLKLSDLTGHLQAREGGALSQEAREQGGYFYLYSSEGMVYALPGEVGKRLGGESGANRVDELSSILPEVAAVERKDAGQAVPFTMPDGERRLVWWQRISKDFDDKVVLSLPEAAIYGLAHQAVLYSIGIGLVGLAVVIQVAIVANRSKTSRPNRALQTP